MSMLIKLQILYPQLTPQKDYILQDDGNGVYIKTWLNRAVPEPTKEVLNSISENQIETFNKKNIAIDNRRREYPSIVDQLDKIYHKGIDAWKADIKAIKDKYPKPE